RRVRGARGEKFVGYENKSPPGIAPAGRRSGAVQAEASSNEPMGCVMAMAEQGDVHEIHQRGLYFEELEADAVYVHSPGRTMTEADNVLFTTMSMNTQALHLDAAYAATQPFGRRVMNSMFTLATMVGQSVAQLTQGTLMGQLGLTDVRFPHPLFPG